MKELLSESVVKDYGSCRTVVRYWRGWRPELFGAVLVDGWTGKETKQETTIVKPLKTFLVVEDKKI